MIGVVLATHGELGEALVRSMEMIVGPQARVAALSLQVADNLEEAATRLEHTLEAMDEGDGALILTDMLGGTPSNMCLALIGGPHQVEVISGVNLPMLLKAVQARQERDLKGIAALVRKHGRGSILVAGEVLEGAERP
jgi:PTS system mannose-specific IIA component